MSALKKESLDSTDGIFIFSILSSATVEDAQKLCVGVAKQLVEGTTACSGGAFSSTLIKTTLSYINKYLLKYWLASSKLSIRAQLFTAFSNAGRARAEKLLQDPLIKVLNTSGYVESFNNQLKHGHLSNWKRNGNPLRVDLLCDLVSANVPKLRNVEANTYSFAAQLGSVIIPDFFMQREVEGEIEDAAKHLEMLAKDPSSVRRPTFRLNDDDLANDQLYIKAANSTERDGYESEDGDFRSSDEEEEEGTGSSASDEEMGDELIAASTERSDEDDDGEAPQHSDAESGASSRWSQDYDDFPMGQDDEEEAVSAMYC